MFTDSVYANSTLAADPFPTTIPSAVPTSRQLCFDFPEAELPASAQQPKSIVRRLKRIGIQSDPAPTAVAREELCSHATSESHAAAQLRTSDNPRFGRPVRMGAAMMKLLKSYGITDAEIAQGIAAYSHSRVQQVAS